MKIIEGLFNQLTKIDDCKELKHTEGILNQLTEDICGMQMFICISIQGSCKEDFQPDEDAAIQKNLHVLLNWLTKIKNLFSIIKNNSF